ncbi:MAG: hypothetical protein CBB66_06735 [bacterium TMED6]|nr:MAG: hypothetical protein CBB66_06735 [bacterium TMED6]
MVNKKYDIVIHGASGFTGKLICNYLFNHIDAKSIKWAISGRNKSKLEEISLKYNVDYFIANSFEKNELDILTLKTNLIISVVGPYETYGKLLVESCLKNSCHYLDITGESSFVKYVKNNFSKIALDKNTLIINCCGFESIPPDIGTFYSIKHIKEKNLSIKCYMKTKGQISGGTWSSFLNHFNRKKIIKEKNKTKTPIRKKDKILFYNKDLKKWALIFPDIDRSIIKSSSNFLSFYGDKVSFTKYMLFPSIFKIISLLIPLFFISILAKFNFTRNWLKSFIPSGTGPDKEAREKHWFDYTIVGETQTKKIITHVKGGDPGYGETSKFVTETALCIILNYDKLNMKKGVLTPASCAGDLLLNRLQKAGIQFSHEIYEV